MSRAPPRRCLARKPRAAATALFPRRRTARIIPLRRRRSLRIRSLRLRRRPGRSSSRLLRAPRARERSWAVCWRWWSLLLLLLPALLEVDAEKGTFGNVGNMLHWDDGDGLKIRTGVGTTSTLYVYDAGRYAGRETATETKRVMEEDNDHLNKLDC